jgi:hypothetical protein
MARSTSSTNNGINNGTGIEISVANNAIAFPKINGRLYCCIIEKRVLKVIMVAIIAKCASIVMIKVLSNNKIYPL